MPIKASPSADQPAGPSRADRARKLWDTYGAGQSRGDDERLKWGSAQSQVDDTITGRMPRAPKEVNTRFGAKYPVELEDCVNVISEGGFAEDGAYTIWPTMGLLDAMAEAMVLPGDVITITLTELVDTGKGNPFKRFDVAIVES